MLRAEVPGRSAAVVLAQGIIRAVRLEGAASPALGDRLAKRGAFDEAAHDRAMTSGAPSGSIGQWLVAQGVTTGEALAAALSEQLHEQMAELLGWEGATLNFEAGVGRAAEFGVETSIVPSEAMLAGLRALVRNESPAEIAAALGPKFLRLTRLGEDLLTGAALSPAELRAVAMLKRGASASLVLRSVGDDLEAARLVLGLWRVRAAAVPELGAEGYSTLLRKAREVRRKANPFVLLELPAGARAPEAKRALRRLAQSVHPDRFDATSPPEVHTASREVMMALLDAERRIRSLG